MCCYSDPETKKRLLTKVFGRRKTAVMWKETCWNGQACFGNYRYGPGVHAARVRRYRVDCPKGIHVWTKKGRRYLGTKAFRVIVYRDSLVRADWEQAVFTKIRITKKEWKRVFG